MGELMNRSAYLVLGMINSGFTTGYEISKWAEIASGFFWSAGDGQVYPQLKKLEQAGLVTFETEQHGARTRKRYALTDAGRRELGVWLTSHHEPIWQLRHESLLQLFFSDELTIGEIIERIQVIRKIHAADLERLAEVEAVAREYPAAYLVQRYGLRLHGAMAAWCDETIEHLSALDPAAIAATALAASTVE